MTATVQTLMNESTIEQRQVVERYVLGQLTPVEQEAFEQYYFEHPEILDQVAAAEALRDGLADHPAFTPTASWLTPLAQVASLVAVVSLAAASFLYLDNASLRGEQQLAAHSIDERVYLSATRSSSARAISLPSQGTALLEIAVGPMGFEHYAVTVQDAEGAVRFSAEQLQLDPSYSLALATVGLIQPAETLQLTVSGVRGERREAVLNFTLIGRDASD